ncbi:MAG: pentapeptide repeat-containing protein [Cyanobacteria bacterium P01_D01_bin.56]
MANPEHLKILNQGVDAWNRWRESNKGLNPDLSYANISTAKVVLPRKGIFTNLNDAYMTGTMPDLCEINLSNANLSNTNLWFAQLSEADLRFANFRDARLRFANLRRAKLSHADFSGADLSLSSLTHVKAEGTCFRGCDLTRATIFAWETDSDIDLTSVICDLFFFGEGKNKKMRERFPFIHKKDGWFRSFVEKEFMSIKNEPEISQVTHQTNIGNVQNLASVNSGSGIVETVNQANSGLRGEQLMTETAREVKCLLDQLSKDYSSHLQIAAQAELEIHKQPALRKKIISALKAGGKTAIEKLIQHPAAAILLATAEGWNESN